MAKITVLHLSDLHWAKSKANDQRIVIDALIEDLRQLKSNGLAPDVIIFTGDLVQTGDDPASYDSVAEHFLDRLRREFSGLPLVVVPGNHDIQREVVRAASYVEAGLQTTLINVDAVNRFVDDLCDSKPSTQPALERMVNFEAAYAKFGCPAPITANALLKTFVLTLQGVEVGIASFNTAWRATGEAENADRHKLLFGERNVDIAAEDLKHCAVRIAAFHHPLDWLADFDEMAVNSRLMAEFDLLMFGHRHYAQPEARVTSVGTAVLSQGGCLYEHRDYFNGYQLIALDSVAATADFSIRTYFNRPRRRFDAAVNIAPEGRISLSYSARPLSESAEVLDFLREARPVIRQAAADQVNIVEAVSDLRLDPKEAFICPPLTLHRTATVADKTNTGDEEIAAEAVLRSTDFFNIIGRRESGKSSLAHYLAVLAAEGTIDRPRIPVVIDFRQMKVNEYGLNRAIATYFGTIRRGLDIDKHLKAGDFIIIVDNFSARDDRSRQDMAELITANSDCRWIVFSDAKLDFTDGDDEQNPELAGFRAVHIQPLPRKAIRELSRRWCEQSGLDNQRAFAAVMRQLRDANLPRTGYMVTLLLWALYQERQFERINEAVLLTNIVDHLLGKADFKQALERSFDPVAKEITLQHLAAIFRSRGGVVLKNTALEELIKFFASKSLRHDAADVLNKLISCGLLHEQDEFVSFKYRCFEEYFIATRLRDEAPQLAEVLQDRRYVDYYRELELLSGLRRRNSDLLAVLMRQVTDSAPPELKNFQPDQFETVVAEETGGGLTPRRLEDIRKKKLTAEQIDDLMDAADREMARRGEEAGEQPSSAPKDAAVREPDDVVPASGGELPSAPLTPLEFILTVSLLGKVLRNSEFNDTEEKNKAARLHLHSSVQMMLLYVSMLRELVGSLADEKHGDHAISAEDIVAIKYLIIKTLTHLVAETVSEQVGTEKLFSIFEGILEDDALSVAERLLAGMLLLELNHPNWLKYWKALIVEAKGKRLLLELLMDRLWGHIHTRPLSDAERQRVESAAEMIDKEFGTPAGAISARTKSLRDAAAETARSERVD